MPSLPTRPHPHSPRCDVSRASTYQPHSRLPIPGRLLRPGRSASLSDPRPDAGGNLCEGAGENAFLVLDGEIWTPPLASSILGGITRDCMLTLARDLGIPVRFETISRDLLYLCDEMFLTGTAAEITPVRSVDRLAVGAGKPGPVTLQLQERFFEVVSGRAEDDHGWLTPVHSIRSPAARPRPALEAVAG